MGVRQFSEQELLGRPLTEQQKAEIRALAAKGDEDIDTSDIPEIRSLPPGAIPGGFRQFSAVRLTPEIHAYFSATAARKQLSLDQLINDILAKEVAIMEAVK